MPDRLARWVTPEIRFALAEQCGLARRTGVQAREIEIMRIRVCRVNASTAEASLVLKDGDRARAAAIRLEDVSGRWLATALDIG